MCKCVDMFVYLTYPTNTALADLAFVYDAEGETGRALELRGAVWRCCARAPQLAHTATTSTNDNVDIHDDNGDDTTIAADAGDLASPDARAAATAYAASLAAAHEHHAAAHVFGQVRLASWSLWLCC